MPKIGNGSQPATILESLEKRRLQVRTRTVNLRNFTVTDNNHFSVDGLELFSDAADEHPVRQLCRTIGMGFSFFKSNPSVLNKQIFDTRFQGITPDSDSTDTGERLLRYRTLPDGRNQFLAVLDPEHQIIDYSDMASSIFGALDSEVKIRESNHEAVDMDHRLSIRASFPAFGMDAGTKDPIEMGLLVDMSEDGLGKMSLTSMLYRLVCENGAHVTYDSHPYFEYNYKGIRPVDLSQSVLSAVGRFDADLEFSKSRVLESTKKLYTPAEVDKYLEDLSHYRTVSAGFITRLRRQLRGSTAGHTSQYDLVNHITLAAQSLPHAGRLQHEYLGGRMLGLNLLSAAA